MLRLILKGDGSTAIAIWMFPFFTSILVAFNSSLEHWFVLPVTLCGIAIGSDCIRWSRRKLDIFDPVGIVGLYGTFFFYVAPMAHPIAEYWIASVAPPPDWRDWLGFMSFLNLFGIFAYKIAVSHTLSKKIREDVVMIFDRRRLINTAVILLPLLALLQLYVYQSLGGIESYIAAAITPDAETNMQGLGILFMISESFPALALICYLGARRQNYVSWGKVAIILIVYLVLALLFGGLRGSRSNTVWGLFFAVCAIHFWMKPINKKVVIIGAIFLTGFMYAYGFFKAGGIETLTSAISSADERLSIEEKHNRSTSVALLGDLGRSDVQSYLLYKLYGSSNGQDLAYGRTYLGALALLVPSAIWSSRPATKVMEGTNALYGAGSYSPNSFYASNVYGLSGEILLNFGILGVPISFFIWGCLVGRVKRFSDDLSTSDARRLIVPILINFCVILLVSDSDNIIFFLFKNLAIPATLIWFCGKKFAREV